MLRPGLLGRLENLLKEPFARVSYTEAGRVGRG